MINTKNNTEAYEHFAAIYQINCELSESTDLKTSYEQLLKQYKKCPDFFLKDEAFSFARSRYFENHRIYQDGTLKTSKILNLFFGKGKVNPILSKQCFLSLDFGYQKKLNSFEFDTYDSISLRELVREKYRCTQWYIDKSSYERGENISSKLKKKEDPWKPITFQKNGYREKNDLNMKILLKDDIDKTTYYDFSNHKTKYYSRQFLVNLAYLLSFDFYRMEELLSRNGFTVEYSLREVDEVIKVCFVCGVSFKNTRKILEALKLKFQ